MLGKCLSKYLNCRGVGSAFFLAVVGGLLLSPAAWSADTPVPADSRLKTIAAKKVIRIAYRADARPFALPPSWTLVPALPIPEHESSAAAPTHL